MNTMGRPPISKYPVTLTCRVTEYMAAELAKARQQLNIPIADIIRECVEIDLPKLIARHIKKQKG